MRAIALTNGGFSLVDEGDFELLNTASWAAHAIGKRTYAVSVTKPMKYMHRVILDARPGEVVDHKNEDGLDNRRVNLRPCSVSDNLCYRGKNNARTTSKFKGVCADKRNGGWKAKIMRHRKEYYLGRFSSETDAAIAYDAAAVRLHGEFAYLNFPPATTPV